MDISVKNAHELLKKAKYKESEDVLRKINIHKISDYELSHYYNILSTIRRNTGQNEEAIELANKALDIGKPDILNQIRAKFNIFTSYYNMKNLDLAHKIVDEIKPLLDKPNIDESRRNNYYGSLYNSIGLLNRDFNQHKEAIKNFQKSLDFLNKEDIVNRGSTLSNIGYSYYRLNELEKSQDFLEKALKLEKQTNNTYRIIIIYIDLTRVSFCKGEVDKTWDLINKAFNILEKHNDPLSEIINLLHACQVAFAFEDLLLAKEYISSAENLIRQMDDPYTESFILKEQLTIACQEKNLAKATEYLKKSEKLLKRGNSKELKFMVNFCRNIFLLYREDLKNAYFGFKKLYDDGISFNSDFITSIQLYLIEILIKLTFDLSSDINIFKESEEFEEIVKELLFSKHQNNFFIRDKITYLLGKIELLKFDFSKAEKYFIESKELALKSRNKSLAKTIEKDLGNLLVIKNKLENETNQKESNFENFLNNFSIDEYFMEIQRISQILS